MGEFSLYLSFVLQLCGGFILSAIRCYTLMTHTCLYDICKLVLYKMISCFAQVSKNYHQRKLDVLKEGNMVRIFKWAWTYNILCIWFFRIIPRNFPLKSQKRGQGHKSICFLYQKMAKIQQCIISVIVCTKYWLQETTRKLWKPLKLAICDNLTRD